MCQALFAFDYQREIWIEGERAREEKNKNCTEDTTNRIYPHGIRYSMCVWACETEILRSNDSSVPVYSLSVLKSEAYRWSYCTHISTNVTVLYSVLLYRSLSLSVIFNSISKSCIGMAVLHRILPKHQYKTFLGSYIEWRLKLLSFKRLQRSMKMVRLTSEVFWRQ